LILERIHHPLRSRHGEHREEYLDAGPASQDTQIARKFERGASLDRLKEWEPMRSKNELAQFCPPWLPIAPNARHWDPRVAGFPAIHATNLWNLRNLWIRTRVKEVLIALGVLRRGR
jgi:hypothetical protein